MMEIWTIWRRSADCEEKLPPRCAARCGAGAPQGAPHVRGAALSAALGRTTKVLASLRVTHQPKNYLSSSRSTSSWLEHSSVVKMASSAVRCA